MYFFIFDKPTQLRSKIRIWVFQILLVFKLTEKVTCYFCCIVFLYWKHGNLLLETVLLMTFFFFVTFQLSLVVQGKQKMQRKS